MASLFYTLDLLEIGKHKLNLNEYLTLLKFQHEMEGRSFPFVPDERFYPRLLDGGFIEVLSSEMVDDKLVNKYTLGPQGIRVFKGDEDLFEEFYALFPHKVPTEMGWRPVSTTDVNSASAKTTRGIWDRVIKNKPYLQRKIIDNLKRELDHRKAEGSLAYLQGIDTWLRQATWEKWDDIPDKKSSTGYIKL
jgi:hypothetical protein